MTVGLGIIRADHILVNSSQIVDPWGRVLSQCPSVDELTCKTSAADKFESLSLGENLPDQIYLAYAEIDLNRLRKVRLEMPIRQLR
jgi:predicted amidohydrolase